MAHGQEHGLSREAIVSDVKNVRAFPVMPGWKEGLNQKAVVPVGPKTAGPFCHITALSRST